MRTEIEYNPAYTMLTLELSSGESVKAEPGAMVAQQDVEMTTGMGSGGVFGGLKRMMGGESFFVNTFTREGPGNGWVSLAPPVPGDIVGHELRGGESLIVQSGSFLASTGGVELDTSFSGGRGLFSGEGLFLLRAHTDSGGTIWFDSYGAVKELEVTHGSELVVDTGHMVAFTEGVDYSIGKVGGIRSLIGGGEGLVMKFRGMGTVWVQSRNISALANSLIPFLPKPTSR
ncbi:MAG: TIGR00266 family protein [Chloroflexota bacterium]|nr:TIGR00266 family protein [Chloroflexota bacterium]